MLFQYTGFLKGLDPGLFTASNKVINEFIIPLSHDVANRKAEIFKLLHDSDKHFCFFIPLSFVEHEALYIKNEFVQDLVHLIFLPNYIRVNEKYLFFFEGSRDYEKSIDVIKSELAAELKKQGINELEFEVIQVEPNLEKLSGSGGISLVHDRFNAYLNNGKGEIEFEVFKNNFVFPLDFEKRWIVPITDVNSLNEKGKAIERFENWITVSDNFKAQLIKKCQVAKTSLELFESENKLLRFKIENGAYSLKLMRDESYRFIEEVAILRREIHRLSHQPASTPTGVLPQVTGSSNTDDFILQLRSQVLEEHKRANAILDWYKAEYEVLPSWYKKFGHLIKVAIGKRTFKSLFKKD
ncbi:MAG: hypothetical protein QM764_05535 [Chitinophagaceae bacterium]